eukprot:3936141-Rhodomonas_salina.1
MLHQRETKGSCWQRMQSSTAWDQCSCSAAANRPIHRSQHSLLILLSGGRSASDASAEDILPPAAVSGCRCSNITLDDGIPSSTAVSGCRCTLRFGTISILAQDWHLSASPSLQHRSPAHHRAHSRHFGIHCTNCRVRCHAHGSFDRSHDKMRSTASESGVFTWPFLVASQLLFFAEITRFLRLLSEAPVRRGQSQWGIIPSTYLCYFLSAFDSSLPAIAARSHIVAWSLSQPAPKAGF